MSRRMILLWILLPALGGCGMVFGKETPLPGDEPERRVEHAYQATDIRRERILSNSPKVRRGMTADEVKALLGEPDEIIRTYDPRNWSKRTGTLYQFIIRKKGRFDDSPGTEQGVYVWLNQYRTVHKVDLVDSELPPSD